MLNIEERGKQNKRQPVPPGRKEEKKGGFDIVRARKGRGGKKKGPAPNGRGEKCK